MSEGQRSYWRDALVGLACAAFALIGDHLLFKARIVEDSTQQTRLIFEQNQALRDQIREYQAQERLWRVETDDMRTRLARQDAQIITLQLKIETRVGSPRGNLIRYLNALGLVAWAKEYKPGENVFRMLHITPEYERAHCVDVAKYRGRTDADIYAPELAAAYESHDRTVLDSRSPTEFVEQVYDCASGELVPRRFIKFWLELTDGTEVIGGIQISGQGGHGP